MCATSRAGRLVRCGRSGPSRGLPRPTRRSSGDSVPRASAAGSPPPRPLPGSSAASPRTVAALGSPVSSPPGARPRPKPCSPATGRPPAWSPTTPPAPPPNAAPSPNTSRPTRMRRMTTPMTHAPMMSGAGRRPCLGCGAGRFRGRGWLRCDDAYPARQGSAWVDIESLPATLTPLFPSPHLFTTRVVGEAGVPPQCTVATGPKRSVCFWSGPWRARRWRPAGVTPAHGFPRCAARHQDLLPAGRRQQIARIRSAPANSIQGGRVLTGKNLDDGAPSSHTGGKIIHREQSLGRGEMSQAVSCVLSRPARRARRRVLRVLPRPREAVIVGFLHPCRLRSFRDHRHLTACGPSLPWRRHHQWRHGRRWRNR